MKCLVPSILDIMSNETLLCLVAEEVSTFAGEFQAILKDTDVLLILRNLIERDVSISTCAVYTNVDCPSFDDLEREVQIKSVAYELVHLLGELQDAFGRVYRYED